MAALAPPSQSPSLPGQHIRAPGDPTRRERAPYHQTPQLGHELGRFLLAGPPPVLEEVHQLGWCTNMYLQTAKWVVHHAAKFVFV